MLPEPAEALTEIQALRFTLSGRVQGIGVRPAVARLAVQLGLNGSVANCLRGVEIHIEGPAERLWQFQQLLEGSLPDEARLDGIECETACACGYVGFRIDGRVSSSTTAHIFCPEEDHFGISDEMDRPAHSAAVTVEVPQDSAICGECLREIAQADNRRFKYPWTSCTRCGPRYSILERMPYERSRSSMHRFELCPRCREEYENGGDRRFHAQTNCCSECGPEVWCVNASGLLSGRGELALQAVVAALRRGEIVALRGVGGYQLICDATKDSVVRRLRERKRRPSKPLAVLVESVEQMESLAMLSAEGRRAATSPANPIVLLPARADSPVAAGVHPGLRDIGLMLPTTALHWRLASELQRPLVVTSGNLEGHPLSVDPAEAERDLSGVADLWLHHDRPILRPIDDSVVRVIGGRPATIRAARGLAPLQLSVSSSVPLLAVGGHQRVAVAMFNGVQSVLGPHLGDMESLQAQMRFIEHLRGLIDLYGEPPRYLVHDLHPDYFTTCWAQLQGLPSLGVQHHHAHIVAGMIEHGWLDREVIGVAFDGTGFGPDGTIWGGEFLLTTARDYRRVGRLRPFPLPGSESAIRQPWRIAIALVAEAANPDVAVQQCSRSSDAANVSSILRILRNPKFSPLTSSVGRLFDGVAALVLGVRQSDFEGQPAMLLESACDAGDDDEYEFSRTDGELEELDWRPMIRRLLADRTAGVSPGSMAMRFHRGLASAAARLVRKFAPRPIVLGGGTFQNRILTELMAERLCGGVQALGLPGGIPPNDGGLAAGQLAVAAAKLNLERDH